MIDTHCHLTYQPLYEQVDAVIAAAQDAGVDRLITVGTSLAERYPCVYATTGVHPHYAHDHRDRSAIVDMIQAGIKHDRVVAIGEMGLDMHYPDPPIEDQVRVFEWQLEASGDCDLPIIIHNREATDRTIELILASGIPGGRFVFHCFTGDGTELDAILGLGAMVSFTGITTFGNAKTIADCAARTPIDRIMVETDSPYLTPAPHRKVRPNQPCYVVHTARFIAERRDMDEQTFVEQVDANADRFFRLR